MMAPSSTTLNDKGRQVTILVALFLWEINTQHGNSVQGAILTAKLRRGYKRGYIRGGTGILGICTPISLCRTPKFIPPPAQAVPPC